MRFAWLGSGSRGNAALVESGDTCILLDCGLGLRETETRLGRLGKSPADLDAVLVTHEHADHIGGVARLAARHSITVRCTVGTARGFRQRPPEDLQPISPHEAFEIGGLSVRPMPVPHDAREPCQFVFSDGASRLAVVTDLGRPTTHVMACLEGCDAIAVECNHDAGMLAGGPYPPALKRRVGGPLGHLSNEQAATLLGAMDTTRLKHVVAVHLSEINNTPALALQGLAEVLGCEARELEAADQENGLDWRSL
ncbi:MAG: MBL fold metallo-hydrolase [Gammaproteobacteria bacterium]